MGEPIEDPRGNHLAQIAVAKGKGKVKGALVNKMNVFCKDSRFSGIESFEEKLWLASPTMHGEEQKWINDAFQKNWITTAGENIDFIEAEIAKKIGRKHAVALSSGTAALHLAMRLAAEKLYGVPRVGRGALEGRKVFASDMTFDATVNPVSFESGELIFIDTETDSWNMDPVALRKAFEIYPDVKLIVIAHLYGTPGKMDEIREIADAHGALIIEDAAESFGSTFNGMQTGLFGDYGVISFNGNKIITGSSGGMFLCDDEEDAKKIRKWSTQSREDAPWYQHEELGYNYRMSNLIAGVVRGQLPYLEEHVAMKRAIYERYAEGFKDLPVKMNPYLSGSKTNHWLSCITIDPEAMCETRRSDKSATYVSEPGKSCPTEILDALCAFGAEGRPIWKPMHMQPLYKNNSFVTVSGKDVGADIFARGLCLPSDVKMTAGQQDKVIEIVRRCFDR